jgi:DNA-binding transcriptional LysR family regulator
MTNLNHLAIFHAVDRDRSMSLAAKRLLVSQPAISKQVRSLEQRLGAQLVERGARGVRLTAAGEILADYTRRIFDLVAEADQAMADLQGLRRGRLTVGASTTLGIYVLPELLAAFRSRHPLIEIDLEVANTRAVQQLVLDHRVDIACTEGFVRQGNLRAEVFLSDLLVPIAAPGHPLAGSARPRLADFCAQPMFMRESGSGMREIIEDALRRRGVTVKPFMILGSTEAIKRAVAAGSGVAVVSDLSIRHELADGHLAQVALPGCTLRRQLHVVWAANRSLSPAARELLAQLRSGAPGSAKR